MENIEWTKEWRLCHKKGFNYAGSFSHSEFFAELIGEEKQDCSILLPKALHLILKDNFYGLANESLIEEVIVVPNEELVITTLIPSTRRNKMKVQFKKADNYQYYFLLQSICNCLKPTNIIEKYISEEELKEELDHFCSTIEVFPFYLPFGNCFSLK